MYRIESIAQYFELVENIWREWTEQLPNSLADIWFRGHADANWTLQPSGLRKPFAAISEHRLRHDFYVKALPFVREAVKPPTGDWEWYFLMQHYGIPTRLLDWSESALVALYFALETLGQEHDGKIDACVWILQPRGINTKLSKIGNFIPIFSDVSVSHYLPSLWDESKALIPTYPAAFDPPANSPRLAAQRGKFTVHGLEATPLERYKQLARDLVQIVVPVEVKEKMRRQFLLTGITEGVLFPSLSGVANEVKGLYSKQWEI